VEDEEEETTVISMGPVSWIGAQIPPRREATVDIELNAFEDAINRVSSYADLRNAAYGADFQNILDEVQSEWRRGMNIVRPWSSKRFPQKC
jgi:hypothetical protein